jgi:5-(carboxyamino)imidazole ribonucleotide mutase
MENLVKIIMGSEKDLEFCKKIGETLDNFKVPYKYRISSAHKTPLNVLDILNEDTGNLNLVYIAAAGRSHALSGFVDANTHRPVISYPIYSDKFAGVDIFSSLRMPSGSGLVNVLEAETAAIAAVKILAIKDENLAKKIAEYQRESKEKIHKADREVISYGKC